MLQRRHFKPRVPMTLGSIMRKFTATVYVTEKTPCGCWADCGDNRLSGS